MPITICNVPYDSAEFFLPFFLAIEVVQNYIVATNCMKCFHTNENVRSLNPKL